ncbi:CD3324 family protein [Paenibacillus radicis (ex Gao et al. 2016)]|uniref:Mor transcription activator domain-containing protein n=1 Tax=Paenibacillus radicis (ex Gao et al. 2016) TaxID=1737354 RepID=A0A917H606_9BACL|nr:CD3324 family protein [Paenibacillus radicis (ex Gao et al. 2016)]GGG68799.1 hypothetical protein GCM10010918_24760 [Paenibacillus radicis (ex Gao et al. 2016)]
MKYVNADMILPEPLLKEIQKYIHGAAIYVPRPEGEKTGWGVKSGSRQYIQQRNQSIRRTFTEGATIDQLADQYFLSCDSIKKIVYRKSN